MLHRRHTPQRTEGAHLPRTFFDETLKLGGLHGFGAANLRRDMLGRDMQRGGLIALAIVVAGELAAAVSASAASVSQEAPHECRAIDSPYKDYSCLDAYLGDGFLERLINYYRLEWGHEAPPADPKAPPVRRDQWPATPVSTPPFPLMALRRRNGPWRNPSVLDRQPPDGRPRQHGTRPGDDIFRCTAGSISAATSAAAR
jgi:hypothetical protein